MKYDKELEFAKIVAKKAGEIIRKGISHSTVTIKSNISPVTETDFKVSKIVQEEISAHFPNHTLLDEEIQNTESDAEYLWICDPIDGTIPFSHQTPTSMFSLALCHNKKPVVAVIYDPYMDRMLYTQKGEPTYCNGKKTEIKKGQLERGDIVYLNPYWFKSFNYNLFYSECKKMNLIVSDIQSYVYQSMLVALGITKAVVMWRCFPWDRAAALLIVQNAGGVTVDETSQSIEIFGKGEAVVSSNLESQKFMLDLVKRCLLNV